MAFTVGCMRVLLPAERVCGMRPSIRPTDELVLPAELIEPLLRELAMASTQNRMG